MNVLKDKIITNFINENDVILDIETNGVSRSENNVLIIGLLFHHSIKENFIQIFSESKDDEIEMLEYLSPLLKNKNIITFNGNVFDIPFLKSRFDFLNLSFFIHKSQFDLYRYISENKKYTNLPPKSLKAIEEILNINRLENFEMEKDINFYKNVENPDFAKILLHNKNDVINTEKLYYVVNEIEKIKMFYFKLGNNLIKMKVETIEITNEKCRCQLISNNLSDVKYINTDFSLEVDNSKTLIEFSVKYGKINSEQFGFVHEQKIKPYITNISMYQISEKYLLIYDENIFYVNNIKKLISRIIKIFLNKNTPE